MDFERESKATGTERTLGAAGGHPHQRTSLRGQALSNFAPEVELCFGPTSLVVLAKAWKLIWKSPYDVRVETLYWFINHNMRSLHQQAQLASLMRKAVDANERWTRRCIHICESKGYVTLHTSDDLPLSASLTSLEPDNRAKYPIPSVHFQARMSAWAELKTRVSISVYAKARHYSGRDGLPDDAPLPEDIDWDVVAWIRNQLKNGDRR